MSKKIAALLAAALVAITGCGAAAQGFDQESALALLSNMQIMNGYPDGSYHLEYNVTRAEFTKIAIAASTYRNSVATNMTVSPFPDVPYTHWAAPYIKLAVTNKLITGYADASFRPDNAVTLEEAATICLKLLGYTGEDFGSSWPYGQMGLANNLELTKNMDLSVGSAMTRGDVLNMIFNMLNTKSKGENSYYIEKMNYQIAEDTILIATAAEDSSVGSGKLLTSTGTYRIADGFDHSQIGRKGDLVLKNGDEAVMFVPSSQSVEQYSIYQTLANDLIVYQNGAMEALDLENGLTVYYKSNKTTLSSLIPSIGAGDVIRLFKSEKGTVDYAVVQTDKMVGPVTAGAAGWRTQLGVSDTEGLTVLRDGLRASAEDITVYDIVYYSKELATVWAYSRKVTGVYEKAEPSRDAVTQVVVSGSTYELETAAAMSALSSTGEFRYGDTVTLLLGKSGGVADVVSSAQTDKTVYGYLAATGKRDYTNAEGETYSSYYIQLVRTDGSAYEYAAKTDYSYLENKAVKVQFENGAAAVSALSGGGISGTVSASSGRLGSQPIAADVSILEVSTTDANEASTYQSVFLQRLDGVTINSGDVLYSAKNAKGEIRELILADVTGDLAQYGIVLSAPDRNVKTTGGTYKIDVAGETKSFSSNATYSVSNTMPVKIVTSGNALESLTPLTRLEETVSAVSKSYIETKNGNYRLADQTLVYKRTASGTYMIIPISQVIGSKGLSVTAYYDKKEK